METKLDRRIIEGLVERGFKVYRIAELLGVPENDVHNALDDWERMYMAEEEYYNEVEVPRVRKDVKALVESIPTYKRYEMRRMYIKDKLTKAIEDKDENQMKKLVLEAKIFKGLIEGITPEMILKAREKPLNTFVKAGKNGMALCPFHNEKTPSFDTRRNFYFCYGCGATGDVIDLVQELKGLTFKEAITYLQ